MKSKIIKIIELYTTPWVKFMQTSFTTKNNNTEDWHWVQRVNAGAVMIIPIIREANKNYLLAIKEWRIPLQDWEYSFPSGLIEADEPFLETAKRELLEETGYDIQNVLLTSPYIYNSAGITDEKIILIFIEASPLPIQNILHGEIEEINVLKLSKEDVKSILTSNNKINSKAWLIFERFSRTENIL